MRFTFLNALGRLHERFLVDVEGVTEVWLVRHGDAYGELVSADDPVTNVEGRIDPPLSPMGREQAARLGRRLAASGVTAVWSSQLERARETASIAAAPGGLRLEVDDRLREVTTHWDNGTAESEEAQATSYIPFAEPIDEVIARMDAAVRDIAADAGPGGRVAAVSHAGAISMYVADLLKLDSGPLRMLPRFTSVTVVMLKDDLTVVQSIGDIGHLLREAPVG